MPSLPFVRSPSDSSNISTSQLLRYSTRLWLCVVLAVLLVAVLCSLFTDQLQFTYHYSYRSILSTNNKPTAYAPHSDEMRAECATLGTLHRVDVPETFRKVEAFNGHSFNFPSPLDHYSLCIPSKNGNRNFGGLFYRLWNGHVPENLTVVTDSINSRQFERLQFEQTKDRLWMVSRSPYARALSTYLDKIYCGNDCAVTKHSYKGFFTTFEKQNVTFEGFLERVQTAVVGHAFFPGLVSPIQRGKSLCYLNHHLCLQTACLFKMNGRYVRVLRLEQQQQWYAQFVRCFGIKVEQVVGDEWTTFSKQPCFYSPTGRCNESLAAPAPSTEPPSVIVDGLHAKAAIKRIKDFYTPRAAQIVNFLYQYDFETLQLPIWDGKAPFHS